MRMLEHEIKSHCRAVVMTGLVFSRCRQICRKKQNNCLMFGDLT